MGEERKAVVVVCKAGGERIIDAMDKEILGMLLFLLLGLLFVFLIVSNILGDRTWIAWILGGGLVIYKIWKGGWEEFF